MQRRPLTREREGGALGTEWFEGLRPSDWDWYTRYASVDGEAETEVDRMLGCGVEEVLITCRCGPRWVPTTCRQRWICQYCRRLYYGRLRHRLEWAFGHHDPRGYWLTLTVRHSGDLAADREAIEQGWRRWRASAYKARGESPPYVGIWENGRESLKGHVHMHVAYHTSEWLDYVDGARWWVKATRGAAEGQGIDFEPRYGDAGSQAAYLAKYMTKGVEPGNMEPERAVQLVRAFRRKRVYTAAKGYWQGYDGLRCRECEQSYALGSMLDALTLRARETCGARPRRKSGDTSASGALLASASGDTALQTCAEDE